MVLTQWETLCGLFFAFFEKIVVPILTSGGLAAVSSSAFAALYSAFGKYDVVHIHAEGPAFFAWLPKMFGKRVVVTVHGIDWQREKWQSGLGSKFIHQGEKNAAKYADEVIVLSKGVQDYFKETYGRKTHFIPNGVNRPQIREASLITDKFGLKKDSYILFLGRLVPEKGIRYLVEAFKNVKTDKKLVIAGGSSDTDRPAFEVAFLPEPSPAFAVSSARYFQCHSHNPENIAPYSDTSSSHMRLPRVQMLESFLAHPLLHSQKSPLYKHQDKAPAG